MFTTLRLYVVYVQFNFKRFSVRLDQCSGTAVVLTSDGSSVVLYLVSFLVLLGDGIVPAALAQSR